MGRGDPLHIIVPGAIEPGLKWIDRSDCPGTDAKAVVADAYPLDIYFHR